MIMAATRTKYTGDHEIQQAAREAARREGKTLGEWLHDTIADRAAELGVAESQVVGQDRADAVYARIERSRSNGSRSPRRTTAGRAPSRAQYDDYEAARARPARARTEPDDDYEDGYDRRYARDGRNARRTSDTLTSFADLLERNEMRRSQERDAVGALTEKLASLESKLTARYESGDHPVKGALARLEARLDSIGRRDAAETMVRANAGQAARTAPAASVSRLEEKLDSILQAVHEGPLRFASETSTAALLEGQRGAQEPARKRLGDAIADISRRQRALDDGLMARQSNPTEARLTLPGEARLTEPSVAPVAQTTAAETAAPGTPAADVDMATLAAKVDALRFDMMVGRGGWSEHRDEALASVRDELETLSQRQSESERRVQELRSSAVERASPQPVATGNGDEAVPQGLAAPAAEMPAAIADAPANGQSTLPDPDLAADLSGAMGAMGVVAAIPTPTEASGAANEAEKRGIQAELTALRTLEGRLDTLSAKVDHALSARSSTGAAPAADASIAAVEALLRELGEKIEQVGAPRTDEKSLDELQQQVERLSSRFDRSEQDLATLPTLAGSVNELFQQFETTRTGIEDRASRAARDALDRFLDERATATPTADGDGSLRAMQAEADLRTRSTLSTVHEMLEKVVGRLAQMETAIAELRTGREEAYRAGLPTESGATPAVRASMDDLSALDLAFGLGDGGRAPSRPVPRPAELDAPVRTADFLGETAQQADFIAAARRAAQSAQAGSVAHPADADGAEREIRAGLLAKSRAFVASNKRPVLVGVAAILMVLGAITVLQRTNLTGLDKVAKAERKVATTKIARADVAGPTKPQVRVADKVAGATAGDKAVDATAGKAAPPSTASAGTDPMVTGSLSKLPSFAAQAALGPAVQQQLQQSMQQPLPVGLKAAAEAGDGAAQYHLAVRYAEGRSVPRDLKLAAHWFEKAAASGLAPAQYRLASMYEKGLGVAEDKSKAKALYLRSAEAGNPRAMHNLGVLLADGGGRPDYAAAADWFGKAADLGVHDSQFNLAILLARGLGTQQSLIQSYRWFAVAASHNDADAARKRDEVGEKLNPADLAKAKALAAEFHAAPVDPAAVDVPVPPGGWDSLPAPSHLNSPKSKVSSL